MVAPLIIAGASRAAPAAIRLAATGYRAYKLGKKTRKSVKLAKAGVTAARKAKNYKSVSSIALKKGMGSAATLQFKTAGRLGKISMRAARLSKAEKAKAVKLLSQAKAVSKIKTKGSTAAKLGLAVGRNINTVRAGIIGSAALGFGIKKKRKPMSAATKAKISRALKGRKRK